MKIVCDCGNESEFTSTVQDCRGGKDLQFFEIGDWGFDATVSRYEYAYIKCNSCGRKVCFE